MSAEVYLDTVDLEAPVFEAVAVDSSRPDTLVDYPLPVVRRSDRTEIVTLRVAVLENAWLKVVFNIDLGGRLWQILDKRSGLQVLAPPGMLDPGSGRALAHGGILAVGEPDPVYGLSTVDYLVRESPDSGIPASLVLHDVVPVRNVGWHLEAQLHADRADLLMTVRIANRSVLPAACSVGWRFFLPGARAIGLDPGVALHHAADRAGFGLFFAEGAFSVMCSEGEVSLARPSRDVLLPRESDAFSLRLVPWSGFERLDGASPTGSLGWQGFDLSVQVAEPVPDGRLMLDFGVGSPVEAAVSLMPGEPLRVPAERIAGRVDEAALVGSSGVLIRTCRDPRIAEGPGASPTRAALVNALEQPGTPEQGYALAARSLSVSAEERRACAWAGHVPGLEDVSRIGLAREALFRREFAEAAEWLGEALEYNAEDPLAWWLLAVAHRHAGADREDRPELLNAHFLAPLEPALRIESFLATFETSREPSLLLKRFAENPDALIDGACLLLEFGLVEDAARWIDEALRHRELPILHYLQAWSLLEHTRMEVEAAQHLQAASKCPIEPPLPWRWVELAVLKALHGRFPQDEALARWCSLSSPVPQCEAVR